MLYSDSFLSENVLGLHFWVQCLQNYFSGPQYSTQRNFVMISLYFSIILYSLNMLFFFLIWCCELYGYIAMLLNNVLSQDTWVSSGILVWRFLVQYSITVNCSSLATALHKYRYTDPDTWILSFVGSLEYCSFVYRSRLFIVYQSPSGLMFFLAFETSRNLGLQSPRESLSCFNFFCFLKRTHAGL